MYRKFYSYNDMPVIKKPEPPPKQAQKPAPERKQADSGGLLGNLESDDIILLVIFVILLMDNCEDRLLLLALGFIFFADYFT